MIGPPFRNDAATAPFNLQKLTTHYEHVETTYTCPDHGRRNGMVGFSPETRREARQLNCTVPMKRNDPPASIDGEVDRSNQTG